MNLGSIFSAKWLNKLYSFLDLRYPRNRRVDVRAFGNNGSGFTAGVTNINFTEQSDTGDAFNGTTYIVQNSNSELELTAMLNATANSNRYLRLYLNGTIYRALGEAVTSTIHKGEYKSVLGEFNAGDQLTIRCEANNGTLSNAAIFHYLNIIEKWEE